jgi:hypothetical protein
VNEDRKYWVNKNTQALYRIENGQVEVRLNSGVWKKSFFARHELQNPEEFTVQNSDPKLEQILEPESSPETFPAFPQPYDYLACEQCGHLREPAKNGMTLRDYFAAQTLSVLGRRWLSMDEAERKLNSECQDSGTIWKRDFTKFLAINAYKIADELVKARKEGAE